MNRYSTVLNLSDDDQPIPPFSPSQVFGLMNRLLSESGDRRLSVRRYKVVPLSERSGVLEWCDNTMPIGEYLVGGDRKGGAHLAYHPKDMVSRGGFLKKMGFFSLGRGLGPLED